MSSEPGTVEPVRHYFCSPEVEGGKQDGQERAALLVTAHAGDARRVFSRVGLGRLQDHGAFVIVQLGGSTSSWRRRASSRRNGVLRNGVWSWCAILRHSAFNTSTRYATKPGIPALPLRGVPPPPPPLFLLGHHRRWDLCGSNTVSQGPKHR